MGPGKVGKFTVSQPGKLEGAMGPDVVEKCTVSQPGKRSNAHEAISKANRNKRINKDQQVKKQKRDAMILQKRLGSHVGCGVLLGQMMRGLEQDLRSDRISTIKTVENLAGLLQKQGKLDEAKAIYERLLQGCEKVLGPNHL